MPACRRRARWSRWPTTWPPGCRSAGCSPPRAGLRVLATGPRFTPACAREGIELLLAYARERYALTVIDCGTLAREADQLALASASHIAWVLPASTSGIRRARPVLEAINPYLPGRELIVARRDDGGQGSAARAQAARRAPPHAAGAAAIRPRPHNGDPDQALEAAQVPLQAILGALAR